MVKNQGFTLTDIMLGIMFTGSLLAILFGYALPTYKKHINDAFAYSAVQQIVPHMKAIDICTQLNPMERCTPGQNNVPPIEESTSYETLNIITEPGYLSVIMTLAGPYSGQSLNYRLQGGHNWVLSCNNKGWADPDLCSARAIIESPYWNGNSNGSF